jgi:CDK inhibitor PHO81
VETYWKSLVTPSPNAAPRPSRYPPRPGSIGSAHTSPSNHSMASSTDHALTISSVSGNHVYIVVQVTRDLHPVVFNNWLLPEPNFDLGVADVTLSQFAEIAKRGKRYPDLSDSTTQNWHSLLFDSMLPLADLLKVRRDNLPRGYNLSCLRRCQ